MKIRGKGFVDQLTEPFSLRPYIHDESLIIVLQLFIENPLVLKISLQQLAFPDIVNVTAVFESQLGDRQGEICQILSHCERQ